MVGDYRSGNTLQAALKSYANYYAFGLEMPGMNYNAYRYGYNGKEKDKDFANNYDYGFRIYNPAVGKFLSVDPLTSSYPFYSPYQFAGNKPIRFIDLDGLEEALPEIKANAMRLINEFEVNKTTKQAFVNISKAELVANLRNVVSDPASIQIPEGAGNYCGLYAFAYITALYEPEKFVSAVTGLYQNGSVTINGKTINVCEKLKNAQNDNLQESAFILSAANRETDNSFLNYKDSKYWNSTSSETMKNWLSEILNLKVTEFDYGYELVADGITRDDLNTLKSHIEGGKAAVLLVSYDQFRKGKGKTAPGSFFGDHFIVINKKFEILEKENKVRFDVYDDHQNVQTKTWDIDDFMDMVNRVLMIEKK